LRELELLKERVERLEERVVHQEEVISEQRRRIQAQEREIEQQKRALAEHGEAIKEADALKGLVEKAVRNVSIAGGVTLVGQGTWGLDEDTLDGSLSADLEIAAPIGEHGEVFFHIEAGAGDGLGDEFEGLGSVFGVNADAGDNGASLELTEAWYEHEFFDERLRVTFGKVDLTSYLDANEVANDETTQFLAPAFVNNPMVEFPENGLGVRVTGSPVEWFSITLGWQEADGDWEDIFDRSFGMGEVGFHPSFGELNGNYRFYGWVNGGDHTRWDDRLLGLEGDDHGWGVGLSFDQQVASWLTIFARAGYQDEDMYEFDWGWSVGGALGGELWGRGDDHFGLAYGIAYLSGEYRRFSRLAGDPDIRCNEHHLETYYSISIVPEHLYLTPDLQWVRYPGGDKTEDSAVIGGVRMQVMF